MDEIEIRHYLTRRGIDIFDEWLTQLADARAQAKIATRINRLAAGNFGDAKPLLPWLVPVANRLGPWVSRLLRSDWKVMRAFTLWRRQTEAVRGHRTCPVLPQ
jgi:hypothetical protein